jgi:hypothetical protein
MKVRHINSRESWPQIRTARARARVRRLRRIAIFAKFGGSLAVLLIAWLAYLVMSHWGLWLAADAMLILAWVVFGLLVATVGFWMAWMFWLQPLLQSGDLQRIQAQGARKALTSSDRGMVWVPPSITLAGAALLLGSGLINMTGDILWGLGLLAATPPLVGVALWLHRRITVNCFLLARERRCGQCGCVLRGSPSAANCPECGTTTARN